MWYKNGTVFNSQQAIRLDNPNTSLPSFMSDELIASMGYLAVLEPTKPSCTEVQYIAEDGIKVIDGVPTRKWKVVDKFSDIMEYTDLEGVVHPAITKAEQEAKFYADKMAQTLKELETVYTKAIQEVLDKKAQETKWDNMQSARAAAGILLFGDETPAEVAMNADAIKLARWYFKVWAYGYAQLDLVKNGQRELPELADFLEELPKYEIVVA